MSIKNWITNNICRYFKKLKKSIFELFFNKKSELPKSIKSFVDKNKGRYKPVNIYFKIKDSVIVKIIVFFLLFLFLSIIFSLLSNIFVNDFLNKDLDLSYKVLLGINTIFVGFIFFVTDSVKKVSFLEKSVLLKESKVEDLLIILFDIHVFYLLFRNTINNYFFMILVFSFSFLMVKYLYKIIYLFKKEYLLEITKKSILKEKGKEFNIITKEKRISNNIFFQFINELDEYEVNYWPPATKLEKYNYDYIYSDKEGWIYDIELLKLKNYIYKHISKDDEEYPFGDIIFLKKNYDKVKHEDKIMAIEKSLLTEKDSHKIFKFFKISKDKNLPKKEYYNIFNNLFMEMLNFIKEDNYNQFESYTNSYLELIDIYLENIENYGFYFSRDIMRSRKKDEYLVDIIFDHLSKIIKKKYLNEYLFIKNVIKIIGYGIRHGYHYKDHYTMQKFLNLHLFLYKLSLQIEKEDLKKYIIDMTWRVPYQTALIIDQERKDNDKKESKNDSILFFVNILLFYQKLFLKTFYKEDVGNFEIFLKGYLKLLSISEANIVKYDDTYELKKYEMLFGLGNYFYMKLNENYEKDENANFLIESTKNIIQKPNWNKELLFRIYKEIQTKESEKIWEWDNIELYSKEEGSMHQINFRNYYEQFLLILLNKITNIENMKEDLRDINVSICEVVSDINENDEFLEKLDINISIES